MKVLVVGAGGREHAMLQILHAQNPELELFAWPGNGGMEELAVCAGKKTTEIEEMVAFAKENGIGFAIIAPDDPLVQGAFGAFEQAGIPAFGPTAAAARIEGSKVFAKNLMKKYGIPTAGYEVFTNPADALEYITAQNTYPAVIKADGLALGKGVVLAENEAEAREALHTIMEEKAFGESGNMVVVEEFLTGPEVSVLAFTDGDTILPLPGAMDHKRALDKDEGPNTGGMGTIAPSPFYTEEIADICEKTIFKPTIAAMKAEGCPFIGCLFFGLMLTPNGPKVIEYNCRFGDPETQVVLPLLKTSFFAAVQAAAAGTLHEIDLEVHPGAAACVVLASGGYPGKYETGKEITGIERAKALGATVYEAGTRNVNGKKYTAGGRVLGVGATGHTLEKAIANAYTAANEISFEGKHYRTDIGQTALNAKKGM